MNIMPPPLGLFAGGLGDPNSISEGMILPKSGAAKDQKKWFSANCEERPVLTFSDVSGVKTTKKNRYPFFDPFLTFFLEF